MLKSVKRILLIEGKAMFQEKTFKNNFIAFARLKFRIFLPFNQARNQDFAKGGALT